jgi:hypothetical protein
MKSDLATAALKKLRSQEETIADLQRRLDEHEADPLAKAVDSALRSPTPQDSGRNRTVTEITRAGIFKQKATPASKAKREADLKKSRADLRREREALLGMHVGHPKSKFDRED